MNNYPCLFYFSSYFSELNDIKITLILFLFILSLTLILLKKQRNNLFILTRNPCKVNRLTEHVYKLNLSENFA